MRQELVTLQALCAGWGLVFLFTPHHIELIQLGQKTQTRRVSDGFRAKVGSVHQCRTTLFGPALCHILITRRWEERLGDISANDALAEGGYERVEYMRGFVEMHRKRGVTFDTIVKCYEFEQIDVLYGPKFDLDTSCESRFDHAWRVLKMRRPQR